MPTDNPKVETFPRDYRPVFAEVERRLREAPWFADGWTAEVGDHESATWLTVSKLTWRTTGLEIHFESWIKMAQIAKRRVPVAMHVEGGHHTRRHAFNASFQADVVALVKSWKGYVIDETGMTRLTVSVSFEPDTLAPALMDEFTRLALLGPVVDRIVDTMRR